MIVFSYLKRDPCILISEKDMTILQISEGGDIAPNGWILLRWELVSAKVIKEEFLGETLTLRVQGEGTFERSSVYNLLLKVVST